MTLPQGIEIGQLAKAKGYVVSANKGKVQFQVGHFDKKGKWVIDNRVTPWIGYDEAKELLCAA